MAAATHRCNARTACICKTTGICGSPPQVLAEVDIMAFFAKKMCGKEEELARSVCVYIYILCIYLNTEIV